jgi:hypothetical protein
VGFLLVLFLPISIFYGGFKILPELAEKDIIFEDGPEGHRAVFFSKASDTIEFFDGYLSRVVLSTSMEKLLVRFHLLTI